MYNMNTVNKSVEQASSVEESLSIEVGGFHLTVSRSGFPGAMPAVQGTPRDALSARTGSGENITTTGKRRGRPPGSKNRPHETVPANDQGTGGNVQGLSSEQASANAQQAGPESNAQKGVQAVSPEQARIQGLKDAPFGITKKGVPAKKRGRKPLQGTGRQ